MFESFDAFVPQKTVSLGYVKPEYPKPIYANPECCNAIIFSNSGKIAYCNSKHVVLSGFGLFLCQEHLGKPI